MHQNDFATLDYLNTCFTLRHGRLEILQIWLKEIYDFINWPRELEDGGTI